MKVSESNRRAEAIKSATEATRRSTTDEAERKRRERELRAARALPGISPASINKNDHEARADPRGREGVQGDLGEPDREAPKHRRRVSATRNARHVHVAGLRLAELTALRWRDVDLAANRITVSESKTDAGTMRTVDLLRTSGSPRSMTSRCRSG
ncbi:MAG: hypothetical protein M3065_01440 [Actinomycetota bacterium]|nr:hypothetical protein [Actinomycetota bacterium]